MEVRTKVIETEQGKLFILLDHKLGSGGAGKIYRCRRESNPKEALVIKVQQLSKSDTC
jgi:hypothetical protein